MKARGFLIIGEPLKVYAYAYNKSKSLMPIMMIILYGSRALSRPMQKRLLLEDSGIFPNLSIFS